ncbi:MAG: 16S rRNA (cytidine(1402)-2'-O)-methyltransferase [Bacteroidales bacterium]|nr:16S rRNA (cytidine(1402)-2'-O)-methyltransferase [Bacteroidales bacterium]
MAKLYLVPTPIGNFRDITLRAIDVLKEVDLVLAEDTRKTGILLKQYEINAKMSPHHQFNEHKAVKGIAERIASGENMALVTDAGTPGISDPGFLLVRECIRNGIEVECLPGATAFVPALVNSGLPCDRFLFEGFLPVKKGRKSRLEALAEADCTVILYESTHRILKALEELIIYFGPERQASVSRELTKVYEETVRGSLNEITGYYHNHPVKGEFVIIISGKIPEK